MSKHSCGQLLNLLQERPGCQITGEDEREWRKGTKTDAHCACPVAKIEYEFDRSWRFQPPGGASLVGRASTRSIVYLNRGLVPGNKSEDHRRMELRLQLYRFCVCPVGDLSQGKS